MNETGFLDNSSNPAHLLIDSVIEGEIDLVESGRSAQSGNQVLKNGIDQLIEKRKVTLNSYTELLNQYQKHIDGLQQQAQSEELKEKLNEENRQKQIEKARLEKDAEKQRLKVIEEERLKKAAEELQLKKTEEQQRLKKVEEAHQKKAAEEQQLKKAEEQQRLKKVEEARLKRVAEELRLKQIEENKRLKELEEQERLKKDREEELKKQKRANELKVKAEQAVKFKRLVRSTIEEITIPLLALNKSFILFDKVWSPLLLQIALADGVKSSIWEKTVRMVRSQVWSLIPKSTAKDLQTLIAIQPHISNSLIRGMHSLKLSNSLQKSLSEYLRLEFEEVIRQSNLNIGTATNRTAANAAKRPLRPVAVTNKAGDTDNNKPGAKSTVSKDDSEDSLIHNSEDLHFYDSPNTFNDDSEDMVIDDADDLIMEDSSDLIIENSSADTTIEGSEAAIIDDIEDFSASMQTGIYQLSSEMLRALNSVTPVGSKQKSVVSTADSIKKGDWVEIKQGSKRIMAKLSWRAADNSLFIFVDDGGKRLKEIDGTTLNGEIESGSMKLVKNSSIISTNSQFSVVSSPEK